MISIRNGIHAPTLLLAFLLALTISIPGCKRPTFTSGNEEDRRELARKLQNAIDLAGGSQAWVKAPVRLPSGKPEALVEARVGAAVYSKVLAGLQVAAEKNRLEYAIKQSRTKDGWRVADVRLLRRSEWVARWKIREVPRILHAAIVIDDLGQNLKITRRLLALPYALTLSVLPHLPDSTETAEEAHRAGHEVMLHLPMEPQSDSRVSPGEGAIRVGMTRFEVEYVLESDLASVPHAVGVNNHMGSRATADPRLMAEVMKSLAKRHLYFVDSRTTADSLALDAARRQGLPAFYRSVFLDDTETVSYTLGQLRHFQQVLEEQGTALAIGHPYPTTIAALSRFLPELEGEDVQLAPASRLLRLPEVAILKPLGDRVAAR